MNLSDKFRFGAAIIVIFHLVGLIGMDASSYSAFFEHISWGNILLSFMLILWCHEPRSLWPKLTVFIAATFVVGMSFEIAGVATGQIFGVYHYTPVLGAAIMRVPLIIGINWAMLTYVSAVTCSLLPIPSWARVIAGALLMVYCDTQLEGFAIRHHFWVWDGVAGPPLRNFLGWFLVSLLSNALFRWLIPQSRNKLAVLYLLVFFIFLLADRFI